MQINLAKQRDKCPNEDKVRAGGVLKMAFPCSLI